MSSRSSPDLPAPAALAIHLDAGGKGFDNGLFRVIREHKDPELRAQHGPVAIEEPRVSRLVEPHGPGRPVDL